MCGHKQDVWVNVNGFLFLKWWYLFCSCNAGERLCGEHISTLHKDSKTVRTRQWKRIASVAGHFEDVSHQLWKFCKSYISLILNLLLFFCNQPQDLTIDYNKWQSSHWELQVTDTTFDVISLVWLTKSHTYCCHSSYEFLFSAWRCCTLYRRSSSCCVSVTVGQDAPGIM